PVARTERSEIRVAAERFLTPRPRIAHRGGRVYRVAACSDQGERALLADPDFAFAPSGLPAQEVAMTAHEHLRYDVSDRIAEISLTHPPVSALSLSLLEHLIE